MRYHYDLNAGASGRPQEVIVAAFPDAHDFRPESIGDCWFFEASEFTGELPQCFLPCGDDGVPLWSYHRERA